MIKYTSEYATGLDGSDPLSAFRKKFSVKDEHVIYLDGNSLGRLTNGVSEILQACTEKEWGDRLIRSWNEGWYTKTTELGDKIALLAGASPGEMIVSDSTSVNLYKLVVSALSHNAGRKKIITDDLNFPSDIYILQGIVETLGEDYELVVLHSEDGISPDLNILENALDENTALLTLSHVVFKSSFCYPMKEVTAMAHNKGALMLWDLSHSIGAVPGELTLSNADLAVGCTYKYLNGGPGAPAFLYIRKNLQHSLISPIWGWFGQDKPFDFKLDYHPANGIKRFLAGTPPLISLVPLERSLDILLEAGMEPLRQKSIKLGEYLLCLADEVLIPLGFKIASPLDPERRGSHISLRHAEAYRICKALMDDQIGSFVLIPDFREPDNIRLGLTPAYTSFTDIYHAVKELEEIVSKGIFKKFTGDKEEVT